MLEFFPIPAFTDNYIWALWDDSGHCLIVDPGDATPVEQFLEQRNLTPSAILITHHHPDHIGGINRLKQRWSLPVYGPARENIPGQTHPLTEGDTLSLEAPAVEFKVIDTPGHTLGHIAFFAAKLPEPILFCGDTLFSGGCGRLFEGTPAQMLASLDRLSSLPDNTRVCCTHEYTESNLAFARTILPNDPEILRRQQQVASLREQNQPSLPTQLSEEKCSNLFLRSDDPALASALAALNGEELNDRLAVFTALRGRKDRA
ncbi:MAG: hydroxyacylglutathione hydrolase [Gammaproteobacteria bacterium HGW-Gammaproteobacteria-14]|nr:MAG: hydroxyacylglutathione hydrolase [Gammaproteobacteria bacterium HGW-Gammaproteobacteria-14]